MAARPSGAMGLDLDRRDWGMIPLGCLCFALAAADLPADMAGFGFCGGGLGFDAAGASSSPESSS